jgi:hypothetical protein
MHNKYRPTAAEVAILVVFLMWSYDREKGRDTSRARISAKTLRTVSIRTKLREAFLDEFFDEMGTLGWTAFPVGDNFGLIRTETIDGWPRIGSSRVRPILDRVRAGDIEVFEQIESEIGIGSSIEPDDE